MGRDRFKFRYLKIPFYGMAALQIQYAWRNYQQNTIYDMSTRWVRITSWVPREQETLTAARRSHDEKPVHDAHCLRSHKIPLDTLCTARCRGGFSHLMVGRSRLRKGPPSSKGVPSYRKREGNSVLAGETRLKELKGRSECPALPVRLVGGVVLGSELGWLLVGVVPAVARRAHNDKEFDLGT